MLYRPLYNLLYFPIKTWNKMNQELAKALSATTTTLTATSTMTTTFITTTLTATTTITTTTSLMVVAIENIIGRGRMANSFSTGPSEPQWSLWWRRFRILLSCRLYTGRKIDQSWISHNLQNSCCNCKRGRWNDLPLISEIIKKLLQQCTVLYHTVYYIITDWYCLILGNYSESMFQQ